MTEETAITEFWDKPQQLLGYLRETHDVEKLWDFLRLVSRFRELMDNSLDVVLPGVEEMWDEIKGKEYKDLDFYSAVVQMTPLSRDTILKHMRLGKMVESVPEQYRPSIEQLDQKSKLRLLPSIEDGITFTDDQYDRIAGARSYQDISEVVREATGSEPRKQWLRWYEDEDGSLWASTARGTFKVFAAVDYESNPDTAAVVEWARSRAGRKLEVTPLPKARSF